jgi:hypothetical protein
MPELPTRNLYLFNVNAARYCFFIQPDSDLDIIDSTAITRTQLPSCGVFHHHLPLGAILSSTLLLSQATYRYRYLLEVKSYLSDFIMAQEEQKPKQELMPTFEGEDANVNSNLNPG